MRVVPTWNERWKLPSVSLIGGGRSVDRVVCARHDRHLRVGTQHAIHFKVRHPAAAAAAAGDAGAACTPSKRPLLRSTPLLTCMMVVRGFIDVRGNILNLKTKNFLYTGPYTAYKQ